MPYEVLEKQIKTLPKEYYEQVEHFVQFLLHEAKAKSRKSEDISEKLAAIYSKIPEDEQTAYCGATLDSWRELTKNDSSKKYLSNKKKSYFGALKNKINYIAPDFDEPDVKTVW